MRIVAIPYEIEHDELRMAPLKWPNRCACCGERDPSSKVVFKHSVGSNADGFTSSFLNPTQDPVYKLRFDAPYCKTCVRHPRMFYYSRIAFIVGVLLLYLWLTITISPYDTPIVAYIFIQAVIFSALSFLVIRLRGWQARWISLKMNPDCSHYRYAVWITSDVSYINFIFFHNGFANEFAALNEVAMPVINNSH